MGARDLWVEKMGFFIEASEAYFLGEEANFRVRIKGFNLSSIQKNCCSTIESKK